MRRKNIAVFKGILFESFLIFLLIQACIGADFRSFNFDCEANSMMDVRAITSSNVQTIFDCQRICIREQRCLSFNFKLQPNHELHLCNILDRTKRKLRLIASSLFKFCSLHLAFPQSCSHAKSLGYVENRNYTIDPDARGQLEPFQVFCDMHDKEGIGVTVVGHDSQNRTEVSGCENPGCYRRDVIYDGISDVVTQLGTLTEVSTHCEQYIKYECRGSMVSHFSWLVSRDGRQLKYWGGAPPGSQMCACGMAGNCASKRKCNCDQNSNNIWQEDSGYLNIKEDLPITMLRFGDATFPHEEGYHTLGELRCYGQA